MVLFLTSPASWVTGQTPTADGGLSLGAMLLSPKPEPAAGTVPREHSDAVVVVGMGVVTPGASDPEELWRLLSGEDNVFVEPDRFGVSSFAATPDAEDRAYARDVVAPDGHHSVSTFPTACVARFNRVSSTHPGSNVYFGLSERATRPVGKVDTACARGERERRSQRGT